MNKPILGLAALLMLGVSPVAYAQDGPGEKLRGEMRGAERADGPRGDGPGGGEMRERGPDRADDAMPTRRAEGPNPAVRDGAPDGERSGAERKDAPRASQDEPSRKAEKKADKAAAKADKSDDDGAAKRDRKAASDQTESKTEARKDRADKERGEDKADTAREEAVGAKDKAAAKDEKSDGAKSADADRKPVEDVKKAEVPQEKRDRIKSAFQSDRDIKRRTDVNIHVSIGTRLPRDWDYAPVPVAVIEVMPEYRGYSVVYVEDEYVICDPVTYEVVAVVPVSGGMEHASSGGGAERCSASLKLDDEEREDILRSIQMTDEVDVSNITVGWSVPGNIELRAFPEPVLSRNARLAGCRYFLAEDQIAIVDPREETVVFLIDQD